MGTMDGMFLGARIWGICAALCSMTTGAGCGDRSSGTSGMDLVGEVPSEVSKETAREEAPPATSVVATPGIDLMQDLVFRKQRDGWTLTDAQAHVTVEKLKSAGIGLLFSALPYQAGPGAKKSVLRSAAVMDALVDGTNGAVVTVRSFREAEAEAAQGNIAAMLLVESAEPFERDFSLLSRLHKRGLKIVGLTATRSNVLADSALSPRERGGGLTARGREFLAACRDADILPDLTYASYKTFWDVLAEQAGGALVSHSAARAIMDHPRNLDDLQITALHRYGGLMGLVLNPEFLAHGGDASLEDAVAHIMHVKALGALSVLALGTDFGGIVPPRGLPHIGALPRLRKALTRQGVTEAEIDGVFGGNAARFFRIAAAEFGAQAHTVDDILRPAPLECDFMSAGGEGRPAAACDGMIRDAGVQVNTAGRIRLRLRDMALSPVQLEIFGESGVPWQVEAQNLAGRILFHRIIQLDAAGNGAISLPADRNLTRIFLSPTRTSVLKEAVIWGRRIPHPG